MADASMKHAAPVVENVSLRLSLEEAAALLTVCRRIGGPVGGPRGFLSNCDQTSIEEALGRYPEVCAVADEYALLVDQTGRTGAIYFR